MEFKPFEKRFTYLQNIYSTNIYNIVQGIDTDIQLCHFK